MDLGFRGEVVDFYQKFRRGYPTAVIDALVEAFELGREDIVVDIGCGTGQLTLPMADRVRTVVGVDPEPDMLQRARKIANERGMTNINWLLGADTDVPALSALLGGHAVGVATIGQALHWMEYRALFRTLAPLCRPGGGIAVVTNGVPAWQHDTPWSRAVRGCLERWLGASLTHTCGTDAASQQRYADGLRAAGFDVHAISVDYTDEIDLDQFVGGLYSAFSAEQLPTPEQRPIFAEQIRQALLPLERVSESVNVAILIGRTLPRRRGQRP